MRELQAVVVKAQILSVVGLCFFNAAIWLRLGLLLQIWDLTLPVHMHDRLRLDTDVRDLTKTGKNTCISVTTSTNGFQEQCTHIFTHKSLCLIF